MRIVVVEGGKITKETGASTDVPWWSYTKTVLAVAALALVRDGKLNLDAPLLDRPYTLRHLLQHKAGLREYGMLPAYHEAVARGDQPWPPDDLLARVGAEKLRWAPGKGWAYSNVGYLFVRQQIEAVYGAPLDRALQALVFKPLGIANARVATEMEDLRVVDIGATRNYHPGWVYHGLVVGPLNDAALLLDRLVKGDLLPPHLMDAMRDGYPVGMSDPARPETDWAYGLGLMMGRSERGRTLGHTGGGPGSEIAVRHLPDRGHTAAAFVDREDTPAIERAAIFGTTEA